MRHFKNLARALDIGHIQRVTLWVRVVHVWRVRGLDVYVWRFEAFSVDKLGFLDFLLGSDISSTVCTHGMYVYMCGNSYLPTRTHSVTCCGLQLGSLVVADAKVQFRDFCRPHHKFTIYQ